MLLSADGESSHFRSSETSLLGQRRKLQINRKVTPIHTIGCWLRGQPFGQFHDLQADAVVGPEKGDAFCLFFVCVGQSSSFFVSLMIQRVGVFTFC